MSPELMSKEEHLHALRQCLMKMLLVWLVAIFLVLWFKEDVWRICVAPLKAIAPRQLYYFSPYEAFWVQVKMVVWGGFILSSPLWVALGWSFLGPAFSAQKQKLGWGLMCVSALLCMSGLLFAYYAVLPLSLKFLLSFETSDVRSLLSADKYLQFVTMLLLAFGIMFLMPLALLGLGLAGVVNDQQLKQCRKWILVAILVVAAVVTPPDLMSQVLLAVPMYGLYELSILMIAYLQRKDRK